MAKIYPHLDDTLCAFIAEQQMFFTATAAQMGHVNVSPKGIDTFRCIDAKTVAYLDLTGSGNETAAHLSENGRLTIMFCSFDEKPLILRLYGTGRTLRPAHPDWAMYRPYLPSVPGERQIVVMQIELVQTSCGFGVPLYEFKSQRPKLVEWAINKGEAGLQQYWHDKNQTSLDGLPTGILDR